VAFDFNMKTYESLNTFFIVVTICLHKTNDKVINKDNCRGDKGKLSNLAAKYSIAGFNKLS